MCCSKNKDTNMSKARQAVDSTHAEYDAIVAEQRVDNPPLVASH